MVEKYVQNTHAKTHVGYTMTVLDVFDVKHKKLGFKDVGNRQVLLVDYSSIPFFPV